MCAGALCNRYCLPSLFFVPIRKNKKADKTKRKEEKKGLSALIITNSHVQNNAAPAGINTNRRASKKTGEKY
jgi:hypothetical protein